MMYVYSLMDEDHFINENKYETQEDAFGAGLVALREAVSSGKVKFIDSEELYFVYTGKIVYPNLEVILKDKGAGFDIITKLSEYLDEFVSDDYAECIVVGDYIKWMKKLRKVDGLTEKIEDSIIDIIKENMPCDPKEDFFVITDIIENEVGEDEIDAFIYDLIYKNPTGETIITRHNSIDEAKKAVNVIRETNNKTDFVILKYSIRNWELNHIYGQNEIFECESE